MNTLNPEENSHQMQDRMEEEEREEREQSILL